MDVASLRLGEARESQLEDSVGFFALFAGDLATS